MASEPDPTELEQQRQREADKLQEPSKNLAQDVEESSQDWQRKRADEGVPGAPQPEGEDEKDEEAEAEEREEGDQDRDEDEDEERGEDEDEERDEDEDEERDGD